ncbi:MAG: ribonuclease H-like domain-containing protein [Lachnospiraceae bacterium]|nr:ribonuclease H-like domain-containing protein [Lachnospiraceae bacterium]
MLIIKNTIEKEPEYDLSQITDKNNIIYFDIETTGFSRKYNHIYLIGCMYYRDGILNCVQYFAENKDDEKNVLVSFYELLKGFTTIIHFNGTTFDMPFVAERGEKYNLDFDFSKYNSVDIYKSAKPFARFLKMVNNKQKTFEQLMRIDRKDPFNGGQLIELYNEYTKKKDEKLLSTLLLHNYEDVIYMGILTSLLTFNEINKCEYSVTDYKLSEQKNMYGETFKELQINLRFKNSFGFKTSVTNKLMYISFDNNKVYISIKVLHSELKYFFPNYKDYFYLPKEDMAVHKSVASYVDKNFREKAKPNNCYIKKALDFIPLIDSVNSSSVDSFSELFKENLKDKISYIDVLKISDDNIFKYVENIFNTESLSIIEKC